MTDLFAEWIKAKDAEKEAERRRREIEDKIAATLDIKETFEGTETVKSDGYTVKIVGRLTRKVDTDRLRELCLEHGIEAGSLFRWKAEINAGAWKNTDHRITDILAGAVTVSPGRPGFTITKE